MKFVKTRLTSTIIALMFSSATLASTQNDSTMLLSSTEIHSSLAKELTNNIDAISFVPVEPDLNALIAQTQLEAELNQFIEQAKSDLPKNRFRVVFAD